VGSVVDLAMLALALAAFALCALFVWACDRL
jgi:hypothetical protein